MKIVIIPDIHGREFWKEAFKNAINNNIEVVFLGDYLDVYPNEKISPDSAVENFKLILEVKNKFPDKVTLLLGNHDCSYIYPKVCECRKDYKNSNIISNLFKDNINLFKLVYSISSDNKTYLFSHAGIHKDWLDKYNKSIDDLLNIDLKEDLTELLSDVSYYRGGYSEFGSCVWADLREWSMYDGPEYQIFGHTQLQHTGMILRNLACLDCRQPFELDTKGHKLTNINEEITWEI